MVLGTVCDHWAHKELSSNCRWDEGNHEKDPKKAVRLSHLLFNLLFDARDLGETIHWTNEDGSVPDLK